MKFRTLLPALIAAVMVALVAAFAIGASDGTEEFRPALNKPIEGPPEGAELRLDAPEKTGQWFLSPEESRLGKAVTVVLGAPRVVLAARIEEDAGYISGSDQADLRRADGGGYEVDWYRVFARWELDQGAEAERIGGATIWRGGMGPEITSIYYLSDAGVGLWVGYYAAAADDTVSVERLIEVARGVEAELAKSGDARATVFNSREEGL